MQDRERFQELIAMILREAKEHDNRIASGQIKATFADMELTDEQYDNIYQYLVTNRITVEGYLVAEDGDVHTDRVNGSIDSNEAFHIDDGQAVISKENKKKAASDNPDSRDSKYLDIYLEEIKDIKPVNDQELTGILISMGKGDPAARNRFIEAHLLTVAEVAGEYRNKGITMEDLVQEGNIVLMQSIEEMPEALLKDSRSKVQEYLKDYLRRSYEELLQEEMSLKGAEHTIIEKSNRIYNASKELREELGRKPDIHELSRYMKLPEEEIRDVMRLTERHQGREA